MEQKIQLVIFDMDGTILDTLQDLTDAVNHALCVCGYPVHTVEEVKGYVGNGIRKLVERAVPQGLSTEAITMVHQEFLEFYPKNCAVHTKPYEGILELFTCLRENGIHIAVNSNKDDVAVTALAKQYFGELVEYCAGAKENVPKKPAPDGVYDITEHFNISRENAVYVGDSDVDILTAINADMNALVVDWGFRSREFLENYVKKVCGDMVYSGEIQFVSDWKKVRDYILQRGVITLTQESTV